MLRLFSFFILLTFLNVPVLGSLSPLEDRNQAKYTTSLCAL
jgi:hypothetical protein